VEESIKLPYVSGGGNRDCPAWKAPSQCPFVLQVKVQYVGDRVKRWEVDFVTSKGSKGFAACDGNFEIDGGRDALECYLI
jgi:hypothetical protein